MKGGIASGVVYPDAICELAQTYRFRNVGGTSAGAIAAAATAAAEYGRHSGGFARFAEMPRWIGTGANLFSLFQPQRRTKPLFNVLVAAISHSRAKFFFIVLAAIRNFPLAALLGLAPGVALIAFAAIDGSGTLYWLGTVCGVLLVVLAFTATLLFATVRRLTRAVPDNYFGICSGASPRTERPEALTPWLASEIDRIAGKPEPVSEGTPLTFGDLWRGPDGKPPQDGTRWLNLEMVTTNLVNRRPERLPWDSADFFFDPDQFADLFPERVARALIDNPPPQPEQPSARRDWLLRCAFMLPRRPLPAPIDLPVIVATRLSLSFPLLLSAIPLWTFDMSRDLNQNAFDAWSRWAGDNEDWEDALHNEAHLHELGKRLGRPVPEICWFSDGGISSNFPIHFFDAPLPRWPTFAVNLRPFHPDHPRDDSDESKNIWMADTNAGGILEWWYRFPKKASLFSLLDKRVSAFVNAVVRTMQNRVDEAQMRLPGYRDRVVHIGHTKDEGGMNLTMDPEDIRRLTRRGGFAGAKLVERFARPASASLQLSWANHRWVRYRSTMAALERFMHMIRHGYSLPPEHKDDIPYVELIDRGSDDRPSSYRWARHAQQQFGANMTKRLVDLDSEAEHQSQTFIEGAPKPTPEVRIVPRT